MFKGRKAEKNAELMTGPLFAKDMETNIWTRSLGLGVVEPPSSSPGAVTKACARKTADESRARMTPGQSLS